MDQRSDCPNDKDTSVDVAIPKARINELTPPVGTSFFSFQTKTWFDNHAMGWGDKFGIFTWKADIYIYATNANPLEPNFKEKGGRLIIIMVHSGFVKIHSNHSADVWKNLTFDMWFGTSSLVPSWQAPATGTEEVNGETHNYTIDYAQTMQMFKNQGNEPTTFDAKYKETFALISAKQYGSSTNTINFGIRTTRSSSEHRNTEIHAVSVFTHDDPSKFPVKYGVKFMFEPTGWGVGADGYSLSLNF